MMVECRRGFEWQILINGVTCMLNSSWEHCGDWVDVVIVVSHCGDWIDVVSHFFGDWVDVVSNVWWLGRCSKSFCDWVDVVSHFWWLGRWLSHCGDWVDVVSHYVALSCNGWCFLMSVRILTTGLRTKRMDGLLTAEGDGLKKSKQIRWEGEGKKWRGRREGIRLMETM